MLFSCGCDIGVALEAGQTKGDHHRVTVEYKVFEPIVAGNVFGGD
jgi:hypothetical protein